MSIHESGEMYLETIHTLSLGGKKVRSVDISEQMGYSKPSVSRAVGLLKKGEYIQVDKDGFITLTEKGAAVAGKIYERHTVLSRMLIALGVREETAEVVRSAPLKLPIFGEFRRRQLDSAAAKVFAVFKAGA